MGNSRNRALRNFFFLGVLIAAVGPAMSPLRSQRLSDSVQVWTRILQTGSLVAREEALVALTRGPVSALPNATREAFITELTRLHDAMLAGRSLSDADEGELLTDYYMRLVGTVAELRTREAALALVPAVTVSLGVERRVARLGDAGVDAVVALIARRFEESSMLETLGLAWFWADSTHAPLSDRSRSRIVSAFVAGAASDSMESLFGVPEGINNAADPAFLPLATSMAARVDSVSAAGAVAAATLRSSAIPKLSQLAATRSPADLARGAARVLTALCSPREDRDDGRPGQEKKDERDDRGRPDTCAPLARDFAAIARDIQSGRTATARADLVALGRRIDQAFTQHQLTATEHALLAGNVAIVVARLGL